MRRDFIGKYSVLYVSFNISSTFSKSSQQKHWFWERFWIPCFKSISSVSYVVLIVLLRYLSAGFLQSHKFGACSHPKKLTTLRGIWKKLSPTGNTVSQQVNVRNRNLIDILCLLQQLLFGWGGEYIKRLRNVWRHCHS